ncbi:CotO family spore coat protein [Virgibacillus kekensis]|uniref:CotO family spore coat protein n=1 Tax=Virgibacillus kekensis TaxID=202261 RepID=A0ABV9DL60_9BACI
MGEKRYARRPLLYIQQPTIRTPEAQMQHQYTTPKKSKAKSGENVLKRPFKHSDFENDDNIEPDLANESVDNSGYDEEAEDAEDQGRKKFKEMTLRERVDYFVNTPKHLPAMKCELKTEERKYRGIIVGFEDEIVLMRVGRRVTPTKIPFETVEEIRLLGF